VFRAYSHWKALSGSKHVEYLLENNLIKAAPSQILNDLYANGKLNFTRIAEKPVDDLRSEESDGKEQMLLHKSDGKVISDALDIAELNVELDRAVWQVENALKADELLKEEERDLKQANEPPEKKG
jgi:hypothetical protein